MHLSCCNRATEAKDEMIMNIFWFRSSNIVYESAQLSERGTKNSLASGRAHSNHVSMTLRHQIHHSVTYNTSFSDQKHIIQ